MNNTDSNQYRTKLLNDIKLIQQDLKVFATNYQLYEKDMLAASELNDLTFFQRELTPFWHQLKFFN
eukprot:UN07899